MPDQPNVKLRHPPVIPSAPPARPGADYAELETHSNFSFLRGASHPDELVYRAAELGCRAVAITDVNSLAGVVRAHVACQDLLKAGITPPRLIIGSRLTLDDGPDLLVWASDRPSYGRLCRLLTTGKRRAQKGECFLQLDDILQASAGLLAAVAADVDLDRHARSLDLLRDSFAGRLSLAAALLYHCDDHAYLQSRLAASRRLDIPLLATNHVHYHDPARRPLQDVLTCIRHGCTLPDAGYRLFANAERYLKSPAQMQRLFADFPAAISRGLSIADQCTFALDQLRYEYPDELVPPGMTPIRYLSQLAWQGAGERYGGPASIPEKVRRLLEHELELIEQLRFESYFLTVQDIVKFARSRGILCQGRGSAANSAVCYCIGVTSVDPARIDMLFERFVSAARGEPPDIDVDFEHERREEVLQYIYEKYGRERAGMTAEVISYRGRSAVRDVGKALGLSLDLVDSMAKKLDWWHRGTLKDEHLRELGLDVADPTIRRTVDLTSQLLGFPRHLSQHVGGMVMTRGPLCELVPIENASMPDRTVIEWDKDDIDALGILKVDVLGLGMLTCISRAFALINRKLTTENTESTENRVPLTPFTVQPLCTENISVTQSIDFFQACANFSGARTAAAFLFNRKSQIKNRKWATGVTGTARAMPSVVHSLALELHTVPPEDPAVYDMISSADTVGVFQIESRAQMSMLPRLRPRCFYDLVIEVAIVRPGPIQGNMVHPYLRRRNGEEPVSYPSPELREVLEKTLGVPLFQEQAMRIAMVGAGFSAGEADQLRRAMAAWRRSGKLELFHQKILDGMRKNGYTPEFAEQCFMQIRGFGEYGFPESHAASFALLVYVSAWLKRYYPAEFAAALINSQPMGFYAPAQIVRDARDHGVQVLPVDINESDWDCTIESLSSANQQLPAECNQKSKIKNRKSEKSIRLGFRLIKGLRRDDIDRLVAARRRAGRFVSVSDLHDLTRLSRAALTRLAEADAMGSLGLSRRQALWQVMELDDRQYTLFQPVPGVESPPRAAPPSGLDAVPLPPMPLADQVMADYVTAGLSLKKHPVALVRSKLQAMRLQTSSEANALPHGRWASTAGIVLMRQRPGTASGIVFITIEDECGIVNLIVRPDIYEKFRLAARHSALLGAQGRIERQGQVVHLLVRSMSDLGHLLTARPFSSRDFH